MRRVGQPRRQRREQRGRRRRRTWKKMVSLFRALAPVLFCVIAHLCWTQDMSAQCCYRTRSTERELKRRSAPETAEGWRHCGPSSSPCSTPCFPSFSSRARAAPNGHLWSRKCPGRIASVVLDVRGHFSRRKTPRRERKKGAKNSEKLSSRGNRAHRALALCSSLLSTSSSSSFSSFPSTETKKKNSSPLRRGHPPRARAALQRRPEPRRDQGV